MKNAVLGFLTILFFVIAGGTGTWLGLTTWYINRDISGWKDRAEVSSEPNDMLEYMRHVKDGMETWGMTSGNVDIFFPTPSTDMGLIYRNVNQYIKQAEVLTTMDPKSPEYQTGLDNLSWAINRLEIRGPEYYQGHQGLGITIIAVLSMILFICLGTWWAFEVG